MYKPYHRNTLVCLCAFLNALSLLACTPTMVAQEPATPTPEVFIPRTVVVPDGPMIAGRALWGTTPIAGARIELRIGAWADRNNSQSIADTVADASGRYQLEAPPKGGEFGLVALWPDEGTNVAPVTPVQVSKGSDLADVDIYLARELELLAPVSGAEVEATPALSWAGLPDVAAYQLWIVDAGTTELVFDLVITETLPVIEIVAPPLTPGHTYTWSVNGWEQNNADTSAGNLLASLTSEFRVKTVDQLAELPASCTIEGHESYVDRANDYCFAYPPRFEAQVNEAGNPVVYGPAFDSSLDPLRASLVVEVQVAVEGKTLTEIVDGYLAQFAGLDLPPIARTPLDLGGQQAEMLEVVPGCEGSRDLFMLRDGTLFHLMFMPSTRDYPQAQADVERLFGTVVDSFALMAPGTAGPGSRPMPPFSGDLAYTRIEVAEAGLSAEVPSGWLRLEPEWTWTPSPESALRLGLKWADLQPPQEAEAVLLPQPAQIVESRELVLAWGHGRLFTVEVYGPAAGGGQAPVQSVEQHALVVVDQNDLRRAFDLYAAAPTQEELAALAALLQHTLDTSTLG